MRNSIEDDDSFDDAFSIPRKLYSRRPSNYIDLEESEDEEVEEEDLNMDMGCPFCPEGFDALGLCVHIEDQHPFETKSGVCPLCATNLGRNMISHLIIQHERILKGLCKRKLHDEESFSIMTLLRKKLQEEHLHSLQKQSSSVASSTNMPTDPTLLSFIYNPPRSNEPVVQLDSSAEPSFSNVLSQEETLESDIQADPLTRKDQEEKAQKCDFVQAMLFSAVFTDDL